MSACITLMLFFWIETDAAHTTSGPYGAAGMPHTSWKEQNCAARKKRTKSFILDRAVGNTGLSSCNILPASDSQNATECNVYVKGLTSGCDPAKTRTMYVKD